ncbi:MAG: NUDIX hydrolase [Solirubrobacterales bacterium]
MSDYAELNAMVRRHRAEDVVETGHQHAVLDFLASSAAPFDRLSFTPGHVTGSAFVLDPDGRTALIFHKKFLWVQPGGHADKGEADPAAVAAREVSEELGLTIDVTELELFDVDVHQIPRFNDEPTHKHFDLRFLALVGDVELSPSSDAADARWFTRSELASIGVDPGLRRMADKAVARRLMAP